MVVDNTQKSARKITTLYQGDCTFCNWCRDFVLKRDKDNTFQFIDIKSEEGSRIIEELRLNIHPDKPDSIALIGRENDILYKWSAGIFICSKLTLPMRVLGKILEKTIPKRLGDEIYDWVGRHRDLMCQLTRCNKGKSSNTCAE